MITIFLIDDEITTRQIISRFLNATEEFSVIGEAGDGIEALELLTKKQPDIIITDICMPKMDGLELVRQIRQLKYTVSIVIMSGYGDFEYARKAIKYNVEEYLLKPFLPTALYEVLNRIKPKIEMNRYKKKGDIRSNFLNSITNGELNTVEILEGIDTLKLPLSGNSFIIGFLRFYCRTDNDIPCDNLQIWKYIQQILPKYVSGNLQAICFLQPRERYSIIFSSTYCQATDFRKSLELFIKNLSHQTELKYKTSIWCGFSSIYSTLSKSAEENAKAEITWKKSCTMATPCNFYEERQVSKEAILAQTEILKTLENKCMVAISLGKAISLQYLDDLFKEFENLATLRYHSMQMHLLSFVIRVSNLVNTSEMDCKTREDFNTYLNDAKAIGSLFETKRLLKKATEAALDALKTNKLPRSEVIVSSIKSQIENNIANEAFSVEASLKGLHYSNNYLCHIFSQAEGKTIKEYLIYKRMQLATTLLESPTIPIKEIAERTGYRNQHYFSFSFKEYFGVNPSSWRENNRLAKKESVKKRQRNFCT